jgi:hypothetical protein
VEGNRDEDRLYSYATQAEAIEESCRREGIKLLRVGKERAVPGGAGSTTGPSCWWPSSPWTAARRTSSSPRTSIGSFAGWQCRRRSSNALNARVASS